METTRIVPETTRSLPPAGVLRMVRSLSPLALGEVGGGAALVELDGRHAAERDHHAGLFLGGVADGAGAMVPSAWNRTTVPSALTPTLVRG